MKLVSGPMLPNLRRPMPRRRGTIVVLSAAAIVMIVAFTAFTVDVGYITLARTQLQNAADASVLAAVLELPEGLGPGATLTEAEVDAVCRQAAVDVAEVNPSAGQEAGYANGPRDVRLGRLQWDATNQEWQKFWGQTPYNMVEVTLHRDQDYGGGTSAGDSSLSLFFAPVIGHRTANISVTSTAALIPGGGIRIVAGSSETADVLPITLDKPTWDALLAGVGQDNYGYNPATGEVYDGSDGILEVNLYPNGNAVLPPGNRGTVDFGSSGNSTNDIKRQILYGLNEDDLSYFGGELNTDNGPLYINGDTGLSAGIKAELEAIKGQPRAIPLFTAVSGPGNNAMYTIVKFVGIRIMHVKLTGSPSQKHVYVQPAPFTGGTVTRSTSSQVTDSFFSRPVLIRE